MNSWDRENKYQRTQHNLRLVFGDTNNYGEQTKTTLFPVSRVDASLGVGHHWCSNNA